MKQAFFTIYIFLFSTLFLLPFGINPIVEAIFEKEITQADRDLARGTFALIIEQLEGKSEPEQVEVLEMLRPKFGYPLTLIRTKELNIEEEDRADFFNGLIVEEEDRDSLVKRVGASDYALSMGGPFPGEDLELKVILIVLGLYILFLIFPALVWTYFINQDIRKIKKSTALFASGQHDVRAKVPNISPLTPIAHAFNHMAEKTQQLLASQKEMSNSVSHEIRTPLARIKFSLEMLFSSIADGSDTRNYRSEITQDVEEIESLVDEMLTYAKFDREPALNSTLEPQEIMSWLQAILKNESKTILNKAVSFKQPPEKEMIIARFEPVYMGWAIRNLVRNAAIHARSCVQVVVERDDASVFIHVDDDGPGIPEDKRESIFDPFVRLDESRNRKSGGYGLGLAIAKRIAVWHGGSIEVTHSSMKGSRFSLIIPMTEPGAGAV